MSHEKLVERIQESLLLHLNATIGSDIDRIEAAYHMANDLMAVTQVLKHDQSEIEYLRSCIESLNTQLALIKAGIA
jgi:hypothetical protein